MSTYKILVTGATGFIGTEVIKLLAPKYKVCIFSRKYVQIPGIEIIVGDLTNPKDIERAASCID